MPSLTGCLRLQDKCRAWDAATQGPDSPCFNHTHQDWKHVPEGCRGQYSDRYARFWDEVAALLAKQYPDSPPSVTGYAYLLHGMHICNPNPSFYRCLWICP